MSCTTTERRAMWEQQLTTKQSLLTEAYVTLDGLTKKEILSYTHDTTEGEQRVKRQDILKLKELIKILESEVDLLMRRLAGCGTLINLNLRRKI